VDGYIASATVRQQFQNPFALKIEAVYVFPLPNDAAVSEFVMTVGERRIRGIIRERAEAERLYTEARAGGYVASLMTQERPNIFTQKVANIEPGKSIDVDITYFSTLAYSDGWYEFVFPMVVGPRFNPPSVGEGGIGVAPRDVYGASGQRTEVQYLAPQERSGHDISVELDVNAGVPIESIVSRTHAVTVTTPTLDCAHVTLNTSDAIPNRDFVVQFKVAGDAPKSALFTHTDDRGGFFTLVLYPPDSSGTLPRQPLELMFVLDCSGSMNGEPIAKAKAAVREALTRLDPRDTFQIVQFSNTTSVLGQRPLEATPGNIRLGLDYVDGLQGEGGTNMLPGIRTAMDFPHDQERLRFIVLLTDGYIGNEAEILRAVRSGLGSSRIFSFGVGSSVNRYLLDELVRTGRGVAAYLLPANSGAAVMDQFLDRISQPALTDVAVDWSGADVNEVYPRTLPDLFVGRPVVVTGRFTGAAPDPEHVRIAGNIGGERRTLRIGRSSSSSTGAALASIWARRKIAALSDLEFADGPGSQSTAIRNLALEYSLLSAYTAFIAVDALTRTEGDHGITVAVPVPVPQGVRYDTTVSSPRGGPWDESPRRPRQDN
jgi:Ca-activated chloride channel family protein